VENLWVNIGHWIVNLTMALGGSETLGTWIMRIAAAVGVLLFLIINCIILVYLERKISGFIQERLGPNRMGPFGIFQLFFDILKLVSKNTVTPDASDKFLYNLVPIVVFMPPMLLFAILPLGEHMTVLNTDAGILYYFAISGLTAFIAFMSGWAANNKYTLLGGMRATVSMISYEIPLVFCLIPIIMMVGSLNLNDIVYWQIDHGWFLWRQPLAFFIFFIASTAEMERSPFDMAEGEQELTAGYQTEYSGMRFAFMYLGEYIGVLAMCWLTAVLFLGGWQGPLLPSWIWLFIKVYVLVLINMWIRWTYPRIRLDHMLNLCWKFLIPLAVVNLVITGVVMSVFEMLA
jgi:NADH-quinone oxidoreductase subunit H